MTYLINLFLCLGLHYFLREIPIYKNSFDLALSMVYFMIIVQVWCNNYEHENLK